MTLPPGVLSECYRRRWRIEQAFDQPEQKLDERQAWGKSNTVKTISAIVICLRITYCSYSTPPSKLKRRSQTPKSSPPITRS